MIKVLAIGIAVLDDIFVLHEPLVPGVKHRTSELKSVLGGNAANAAMAVTHLGGRASLIARLGEDFAEGTIRAWIREQGIDTDYVRAIPGRRSSRSSIIIEPGGDRTVINFADPDMPDSPDWLPTTLPLDTSAVTGDTRWESGSRRLFELARAKDIPAIFDGDRQLVDASLLDLATHVGFSAQGLKEMSGTEDLAEGLRRIAGRHTAFLAVTNGENGVYALQHGEIQHYPAFPIKAVDTLGAGDVWHGALAFAVGSGMPIARAIPFASAASALKCTRIGGGAGAPSLAEVETMLAGYEIANPS